VLAAFVQQERAGVAGEYDAAFAVQRSTQLLLGCAAIIVGVLGVGLLFDWNWLAGRWPWPLPSLPAGIVGTWLVTYAVGFLWCVLREREWRRMRIAVLALVTTIVLDLASGVRLRDSFDDGISTVVYFVGLGGLLVTIVVVALVEEGRLRAPVTPGSEIA
jgi:Kef-type K+ transport system membrane component KefB